MNTSQRKMYCVAVGLGVMLLGGGLCLSGCNFLLGRVRVCTTVSVPKPAVQVRSVSLQVDPSTGHPLPDQTESAGSVSGAPTTVQQCRDVPLEELADMGGVDAAPSPPPTES